MDPRRLECLGNGRGQKSQHKGRRGLSKAKQKAGSEALIHLMRTGEVEANLVTLNEEFRLPYIADLVARKLAGPEKARLNDADVSFHQAEYARLRGELQAAHDASRLPEVPSEETRAALNDLLIRVRLAGRKRA